MKIEYANGRKIEVDSEDKARKIIEEDYPDAVYGDDWELGGWDGETPIYRLLVWENEEIAGEPGCGDDGSHAIAEIIRGADP